MLDNLCRPSKAPLQKSRILADDFLLAFYIIIQNDIVKAFLVIELQNTLMIFGEICFRSRPFHHITHRRHDSFPKHPFTDACRGATYPSTQNAYLWNSHIRSISTEHLKRWWTPAAGITDRFQSNIGFGVQSLHRISIVACPRDGHIGVPTQS